VQERHGELTYDVIDGKQRLETVLKYQGVREFRRDRFSVRMRLNPDEDLEDWDWRRMQAKGHGASLMGYKFQTVEIRGNLSDIIDLFVRINSTGKRLSGAEKRHARFFRSDFLKYAGKVAESKKRYFLENRILSWAQISRMKHIELTCELMVSVKSKQLINKKKALDNIIAGQSDGHKALRTVAQEAKYVMNLVIKMFPHLRSTRFANSVDYYSLFMLVWAMHRDGCVLADPKRNRQAEKLLIRPLDWGSIGCGSCKERLKGRPLARGFLRIIYSRYRGTLIALQPDKEGKRS